LLLPALKRVWILAGAWPFGVVELSWAGIAIRRFKSIAAGKDRA
jgi:hypothetical protein